MTQLDARILLRATKAERDQINADAKARGLSTNSYVRSVMLGYSSGQEDRLKGIEERLDALEGHRPANQRRSL